MAKTLGKTDYKPTQEEIARRAYLLFEQSGRIPGRDLENWLAAEAQLGLRRTEASSDSASAAPTLSRPLGQESSQRRI